MTAAEAGEPRAEQRERERAERAEWSYLIGRLGVMWPNYDCFCGSLDDLRRTVADLERKAARDRPARREDAAAGAGHRDASAVGAGLWARRQLASEAEEDSTRREQLARWHTDDHEHEHGHADGDAD